MKEVKIKRLLLGLIPVMLLLVSISCITEETESKVKEEKPTLTEEQQEEWVERGCLAVSTIEEASRLAGYKVAMPTSIPESYLPGDFVLNQLGFPPQLGGEWGQARRAVEQHWTWPDSPKINILLIQHPGTDQNIRGEPIEICGRSGGRGFFEAGNGREYPFVVLHWRDGDIFYSLGGSLVGTLTEETLHQIACSVRVKEEG
ncbi:hypothetical protein ACFLVG_01940 [Chloroflexota bacterium]